MTEEKILVFLSRPNPFIVEHEIFLSKLKNLLSKYNIETITLQANNYDLTDTISYLKGMIRRCYGIIIVGFKQIFIKNGVKKLGGVKNDSFFYPEETDISGQAITSPFCHIEGTIGLMYDLPLLIINEKGVREEGIITGGRFSYKTNNFHLLDIDDFFNDCIINQQILTWIGKVEEFFLFLNLKKIA